MIPSKWLSHGSVALRTSTPRARARRFAFRRANKGHPRPPVRHHVGDSSDLHVFLESHGVGHSPSDDTVSVYRDPEFHERLPSLVRADPSGRVAGMNTSCRPTSAPTERPAPIEAGTENGDRPRLLRLSVRATLELSCGAARAGFGSAYDG